MLFRRVRFVVFPLLILFLVGCNLPPAATAPIPSPTAALPAATGTSPPTPAPASPTVPGPAETPLPTASEAPGELDERPPEAILTLEPGPGSVVTSPVQVTGEADSTFEQSLVVQILLADGMALATEPVQIENELGQHGPFRADVSFAVDEPQQGFIQVYATSPRDGGITHLASVGVTLANSGEADIIPGEPHPERIAISSPAGGETLSGGVAHVEGFALASFEQTLLVEILDEAGSVIGSQPVMVEAPDLGEPGPFRVDVPYLVSIAGPGRVVVRDISPAFGGDTHRASVEVRLAP